MPYKSASQRTRIITEAWTGKNLYCPSCPSSTVTKTPENTEAVDFVCPACNAQFQLKATRKQIGRKVPDAAYDSMMRALLEDRFPHLLLLRYNHLQWRVIDLLLVPSFLIPPSAIEARRPLGSTARRAGWVGCSIVLDLVPPEGRIRVISGESAVAPDSVRNLFRRLLQLRELPTNKRGWTLDVLTVLRSLSKTGFTLVEAYSFENILSARHPENKNVRAKIRQQLQILRDMGYLDFLGRGSYRWRQNVFN